MIKEVIFDAGGVLHAYDSKYVGEDIVRTLGITDEACGQVIRKYMPLLNTGKIDEAEFWEKFIEETKAPNDLPNESLLAREYRNHYKIHEDVIEIVKELKEKGIKLAILSNTIEAHAKVNREMGIYDEFTVTVLSNEVGITKPNPKIFQLALDAHNVGPEEAVFIDDLEENVEAAKKLGMHGIVFKDASQLREDLNKLGI